MTGLSATTVLQVWEWGRQRHPVDRALLILWAAEPGASPDALARLPVGQRDARLLGVQSATFGPLLHGLADCPACSSTCELAVSSDDLLLDGGDGAPCEVEILGYRLRLRALDSRDLAAAARRPDVATARRLLCERAVVRAERDGEVVAADALPDGVAQAIARAGAERDPQADVTLALSCPDCGHDWEVPFDVLAFLWAEIAALGRRLLHEVSTIARAYAWRESDILALSPARRQAYLELVGAP